MVNVNIVLYGQNNIKIMFCTFPSNYCGFYDLIDNFTS